jgi:hypothetical protein
MKNKAQYRQGDVFIEGVTEIPTTAQKQDVSRNVILAHGEVTGHHHVLSTIDPTDWWKQGDLSTANDKPATMNGELFFSLPKTAMVTHPEHATIELPPGNYRVTRQREYSPAAIRKVAD